MGVDPRVHFPPRAVTFENGKVTEGSADVHWYQWRQYCEVQTFEVKIEGEIRFVAGGNFLHDDGERVHISFAIATQSKILHLNVGFA